MGEHGTCHVEREPLTQRATQRDNSINVTLSLYNLLGMSHKSFGNNFHDFGERNMLDI